MSDVETVKKCLETILEKGDVYDTIAVRENVKSLKHSFFRDHAFVFSRILYGGIRVCEKVKSRFSPIECVRRAQNEVRKIIGINIDIVRSKHEFNLYSDFNPSEDFSLSAMKEKYNQSKIPTLSILYENANVKIDEYIDHLKKILTFCELYNLDEILLREKDILNLFPELDLENYPHTTMKKILDCTYYQFPGEENHKEDRKYQDLYDFDETFSSYFLQLNPKQLRSLIKKLEIVKVSKKIVSDLGELIEDIPIKNAIDYFLKNGDLLKLKATVNNRLSLLINSDSTYKDRVYGKVSRNVTIKDEYIKVVSINQKGEIIGNQVITLYDFLEIPDYRALKKQLELKDDNHELLAISALHLYLCQSIKIKGIGSKKSLSFYDYIYHNFQAKRKGRVKKIPGLYSKTDKTGKNYAKVISNTIMTILLAAVVLLTGASIDFINQFVFHKEDQNIVTNITETVLQPYITSYEFERNLVGEILHFMNKARIDFSNLISPFVGDSEEVSEDENVVLASIYRLDECTLPTYFATQYADSATYDSGEMEYSLQLQKVTEDDFEDVLSKFEVSVNISPENLKEWTKNSEFHFPKLFYPLDNGNYLADYVLTQIYIYDSWDPDNMFVVDAYRMSITGYSITDYEMWMLESMHDPKMVYVYGIGQGMNSFIENVKKTENYTSNDPEVIRNAIIRGLDLENDASDSEIYDAIHTKDYSLTPIKDAHLSWFIKTYSEEKYFEKIASMDSIICNLAATLAVGVDEELVYTVGYLNYDDGYIKSDEAHAWALRADGTLVDATPASSSKDIEEDGLLFKLLVWGVQNKVPWFLLAAYVAHESNKLFGKKIRVFLNVKKVSRELTSEDIEESYATLRTALYGGINIPVNRTPMQLAETISREFSGFTIQELEDIKSELIKSEYNQEGELDSALKLIQDAKFLKNNSNKVKKMLQKKMNSTQK